MKHSLTVDLERQAVHPGDEVRGSVVVSGGVEGRELRATLHGEEIVAANNIIASFVSTVVNDVRYLGGESAVGGPFPFVLQVPEDAPPSYASRDLRCAYTIDVGLTHKAHQRFHLTVLPAAREDSADEPHDVIVEESGARLEVQVARAAIAAGEALEGRIRLTAVGDLPARVSLHLAAVEESTTPRYHHRKTLWEVSHDVRPTEEVTGVFALPVPSDAVFSGEWSSFRVFYELRATMELAGRRQVSRSLPVRVFWRGVPVLEP